MAKNKLLLGDNKVYQLIAPNLFGGGTDLLPSRNHRFFARGSHYAFRLGAFRKKLGPDELKNPLNSRS